MDTAQYVAYWGQNSAYRYKVHVKIVRIGRFLLGTYANDELLIFFREVLAVLLFCCQMHELFTFFWFMHSSYVLYFSHNALWRKRFYTLVNN